jgi:flagellar FliL protein
MEEDQMQEAPPERPPEPKKQKQGFLKIFVIGFVAAVLASGAGFYFYGKVLMAHYVQKQVEKQVQAKKLEKAEVGPIVSLEPFVINVSGNSSRFVKISVAIELKDEKAVELTKKMAPVVRDAMLSVLAAKTPEAFMDIAGRSAMKQELFDGVSRLFADGGLKAIYITDIIMQ